MSALAAQQLEIQLSQTITNWTKIIKANMVFFIIGPCAQPTTFSHPLPSAVHIPSLTSAIITLLFCVKLNLIGPA